MSAWSSLLKPVKSKIGQKLAAFPLFQKNLIGLFVISVLNCTISLLRIGELGIVRLIIHWGISLVLAGVVLLGELSCVVVHG